MTEKPEVGFEELLGLIGTSDLAALHALLEEGYRCESRVQRESDGAWTEWQVELRATITEVRDHILEAIDMDKRFGILDFCEYRVIDETDESVVGVYRKGVVGFE